MLWVFLIVGLVAAAFAIPKLGKALLILLGIALAVAALGVCYLIVTERQNRAEREAAKHRITRNEIELADLTLGKDRVSPSGYTLRGRVRNRSANHSLTDLTIRLTMKDCAEPTKCEVVGQTEERIHVTVPPGQARDLYEYVYFSNLGSARGKHEWDYDVVEILGK